MRRGAMAVSRPAPALPAPALAPAPHKSEPPVAARKGHKNVPEEPPAREGVEGEGKGGVAQRGAAALSVGCARARSGAARSATQQQRRRRRHAQQAEAGAREQQQQRHAEDREVSQLGVALRAVHGLDVQRQQRASAKVAEAAAAGREGKERRGEGIEGIK